MSSVVRLANAEKRRLRSLHSYKILDTISEAEYDRITKIAAGICNVPVSLMTLLDEKRQWFKSNFGFEIKEIPRELAFCNHLLTDPHQVLVVPDLREDDRFAANPLVVSDPNVVFYAGASLVNEDGHVLGSICVYDRKANTLDEHQKSALAALAQQVMNSLELRKKVRELKQTQYKLKKVNRDLKKFAHVVSHDIKTPLASISMLVSAVQDSTIHVADDNTRKLLELMHRNAGSLRDFIDQVLEESGNAHRAAKKGTDPHAVIEKVKRLLVNKEAVKIEVKGTLPALLISGTQLQQILQNLITNAIKYNDKEQVVISISGGSGDGFHHLSIADNGIGIPPTKLDTIFEEHQTLGKTDRFGNKGTGIGLCTVKRVLTQVGGDITVTSKLKEGSIFTILIPSDND